jgi:hypothetical protein
LSDKQDRDDLADDEVFEQQKPLDKCATLADHASPADDGMCFVLLGWPS